MPIRRLPKKKNRRNFFKWLAISLSLLLVMGCAGLTVTWFLLKEDITEAESSTRITEVKLGKETFELQNLSGKEMPRFSKRLSQRNAFLRQELAKLAPPEEPYLIIDTAHNRLYMKKGEEILREAICSTGSGRILLDANPKKKRQWIFDTPRGEFLIRDKKKGPVWRKPDWAFIEEGEAPPKNEEDRIETGTLGDYAMAFGNGFFIHGTLYTRLLGRSVTHGCVRLGDEDLEFVYKNSNVGTRLYIF